MITSFRPAHRGESGAVSLPGFAAAAAGAALVAGTLVFAAAGPGLVVDIVIVAFSGLFGSVVDSFLGAAVQAQYQTDSQIEANNHKSRMTEIHEQGARLVRGYTYIGNDSVNLVATLAAATLGFVLNSLV